MSQSEIEQPTGGTGAESSDSAAAGGRCYRCFRPQPLCFCDAIPQIHNRTSVLLLQHVGERRHPFNTARIVHRALDRCHLITDHNRSFSSRSLPIVSNAGLLFPSDDAIPLDELGPTERPDQLVIVDGTWSQAKTIVRDVAQLAALPRYRLSVDSPGQYRIRREPNDYSLSTVEATVAALTSLEPETNGLKQLLRAFDRMVDQQLVQAGRRDSWRRNERRQDRPRHVPRALLENAHRLVVAYGESPPRRLGLPASAQTPINWTARRLSTGELFTCCLRPPQPLTADELAHMQLAESDFDAALTVDQFRHNWRRFSQPNDVLVVYHQKTYDLLRRLATAPHCLVLKSIFGNRRTGSHSLEELLHAEGLPAADERLPNRAQQRLDMAVRLVEHLR